MTNANSFKTKSGHRCWLRVLRSLLFISWRAVCAVTCKKDFSKLKLHLVRVDLKNEFSPQKTFRDRNLFSFSFFFFQSCSVWSGNYYCKDDAKMWLRSEQVSASGCNQAWKINNLLLRGYHSTDKALPPLPPRHSSEKTCVLTQISIPSRAFRVFIWGKSRLHFVCSNFPQNR